ncbi:hypothetical protein HIM_02754 [Hirsutella minnesotensis 3608]|nr:hypothetical protein HIM_02754 [Hirsutella minnesotensis 3608]
MAATIKPIDGRSVHQIQSGQVIVDLCSVVKELLENSVDAEATVIDVRFKNQGLDLIEVQDNGSGISPANYASIALKHHTSKLSTFSDLASLQTFGFRGEALASLCALSNLTVTTCLQAEVPKGSRLSFEPSGKLKGTSVVAAQRGTTVSVDRLFHNLPVRRRELERNIKREWQKVIVLLNQYACIQTNVKLSVSQQPTKGKRVSLFSTKGNPTTRENIINIFGAKTMSALVRLDLELELQPTSLGARDAASFGTCSRKVRVVGHISRPSPGDGRQTPDRQMFFVNGRPCGLPQFAKTFNEVYRSYNHTQSPFILADVQMDTQMYDVNVSPDKRSILLHDQGRLLDTLRTCLMAVFDTHDCTVPVSLTMDESRDSKHDKAVSGQEDEVPPRASRGTRSLLEYEVNDGSVSCSDSESESSDSNEPGRAKAKQKRDQTSISQWLKKDHATDSASSVAERAQSFRCSRDASEGDSRRRDESNDDESCRASSSKVSSDAPRSHLSHLEELEEHASSSPRRLRSGGEEASGSTAREDKPDGMVLEELHQETDIPAVRPIRLGAGGFQRPRLDQSPAKRSALTLTSVLIGPTKADEEVRPIDGENQNIGALSRHRVGDMPSFVTRQGESSRCSSETDEPQTQAVTGEDAHSSRNCAFSDNDVSGPGHDLQRHVSGPDLSSPDHAGEHRPANSSPLAGDNPEEGGSDNTVVHVPALELPFKRSVTIRQAVQRLRADEDGIRSQLEKLATVWHAKEKIACSADRVEDINASDAESRLTLIISRNDFATMRVVGQFNLGFIIAVRPASSGNVDSAAASHDELFIIDQHASDEKYNFERLQSRTVVQAQQLVHPKQLQLTALEEEIVKENLAAIEVNGFKITVDETGDSPVGMRCQALALPLSRETTFTLDDFEELIALLGDKPSESGHVPRPSKVRKMFAMRACRSSVMIGKALTRNQMYGLVRQMGELDKPWNCPHGRPTMRHLCRLQAWEEKCWKDDSTPCSLSTWKSYQEEA